MGVMSRTPLLLALLVAMVGAGTPVRAWSLAPEPSRAPAAAHAGAPAAAFNVIISVNPNPSNVGAITTIAIQTSPNASCVIQVILPNGGLDPSPAFVPQGADNNGSARWVYIPSPAALGTDTVTVSCQLLDTFASGSLVYTIGPPLVTVTPTLLPTPLPGVPQLAIAGPNPIQPGATFALNGAGFTPGATVSFTALQAGNTYSATVSMSGTFTIANITVPYNQAPGKVLINLRDSSSQLFTPITLLVSPIAPSLKLSTSSAAVTDTVAITGTGFGANEVVDVTLGPIRLLTAKTDNSGTFNGAFSPPNTVPFGAYNVAAKGESTGALGLALLLVSQLSPFANTPTQSATPTATPTPGPPTATPTNTPVPLGPTQATYFLAEGTTASGNQETLNILNPAPILANVDVALVFPDGVVKEGLYLAPARALTVLPVNTLVGSELGQPVSARVSADQQITVSRAIDRIGRSGTLADGVPAIQHYAYFAEGYTSNGFHETLALFNPVNANASVQLLLLPSNGKAPISKQYVVGPLRRFTIDVNALAPNQAVGAEVISDVELAVERTLTFGQNQHGAATVPGTDAPQSIWYFAEGSTKNGFGEFITMLNPDAAPASVTIAFFDPSGKQIGSRALTVKPHTRATLNVGSVVSATSVGAIVRSSVPILAERSMYRGALSGPAVVGSGSFGRAALASAYDFPSGNTAPGHSEFLLLFNPNDTPDTIAATFYSLSGTPVGYVTVVPPRSRITVNVGRDVPGLPVGQHGVSVRSVDNTTAFMAEQSLYGPGFSSAATTQGVPRAIPTAAPPAAPATVPGSTAVAAPTLGPGSAPIGPAAIPTPAGGLPATPPAITTPTALPATPPAGTTPTVAH